MAYILYDFFPLNAQDFVKCDLREAFGVREAVDITAEQVNRVHDHNRPPQLRVDFFAYMPTGEVIRFHPGHKSAQDAKPHHMLPYSCLFRYVDAYEHGVGHALHRIPPGFVTGGGASQPVASSSVDQPGVLAFQQAHSKDMHVYDIQHCTWKKFWQVIQDFDYADQSEIDITDGAFYPWWLWLSTAGNIQQVTRDGVSSVRLSLFEDKRCIIISSLVCHYRVFRDPRSMKMVIEKVK